MSAYDLSTLPPTAPPALAAVPVCQAHPLAPLTGTCGRCGRFWCVECAAQGQACPVCQVHQLRALPSLTGRHRWARWGVIARLCVFGMLVPGHLYGLTLLDAQGEIAQLPRDYAMRTGVNDLVLSLSFLASAVLFLRWLHLLVRTAEGSGAEFAQSPASAVGWWLMPVANLVKPYLNVRELLARLSTDGTRVAAPLGLWWTAWLLMLFVGKFSSNLSSSEDPRAFPLAQWMGLAAAGVALVAGMLCLKVMAALQRAVEQRVAEVAAQALLLDKTLPPTPARHTRIPG